MAQIRRFLQLSPARQALIRWLQKVNFGDIRTISIQDGDPIFDQHSVAVFDLRLDRDENARPELRLADFDLPAEVRRLISLLDELKDGTIQRLEVRAGIPHRLFFESHSFVAQAIVQGSLEAEVDELASGVGSNKIEMI